jgi:hypothetical protein
VAALGRPPGPTLRPRFRPCPASRREGRRTCGPDLPWLGPQGPSWRASTRPPVARAAAPSRARSPSPADRHRLAASWATVARPLARTQTGVADPHGGRRADTPYPLSDETHPEHVPTGTVVPLPLSWPLQVVA